MTDFLIAALGTLAVGLLLKFVTRRHVREAAPEMLLVVHPAAVAPLRVGGNVIPNSIAHSVLAFICLYFVTVASLTFALLLSGLDIESARSAIIACINNAGPGLNEVGPARNYAGLTDFQKWMCATAMLAGRIEIFTLLILFARATGESDRGSPYICTHDARVKN